MNIEEDYQKAVAVVRKCSSGSVSNIQRKLYWGYCRAASAVDRMQDEFIVSPMSASGRRDVYPEEIHELWKELQSAKSQTIPEGFVLVKKECPDPVFADNLFQDLKSRSFICDGEEFINLSDIDAIAIWQMVIEAQEQSYD